MSKQVQKWVNKVKQLATITQVNCMCSIHCLDPWPYGYMVVPVMDSQQDQ